LAAVQSAQANAGEQAISRSRLAPKKAAKEAAKTRKTIQLASVKVSASRARSVAAKSLAAKPLPAAKLQNPYRLKTAGAKSE